MGEKLQHTSDIVGILVYMPPFMIANKIRAYTSLENCDSGVIILIIPNQLFGLYGVKNLESLVLRSVCFAFHIGMNMRYHDDATFCLSVITCIVG